MDKYLLLFGVFFVTWQIQSAAGFPGYFKNSPISPVGDVPEETTETVDILPYNDGSPANELNCNDLKPNNASDHMLDILKRCNSLKSSEKDMMLKPTISNESDINLFNKFADNLKSIDGVGLELGKTELMKVDMPNLQDFTQSKGLYIDSNQELKYVNIKVANEMLNVSNLYVRSNPQLISFLLRASYFAQLSQEIIVANNTELVVFLLNVYSIAGRYQGVFKIANNPNLESVYLKSVAVIADIKNMSIVNNPKLKTIDAPKLVKIVDVYRFEISGNKNLVNLTFPTLVHHDATYTNTKIIIRKNDRLELISMKRVVRPFPELELQYTTRLSIQQNPVLTTIDIDMNVLIAMHLKIRGNPKLDKNWLRELRKLKKSSKTKTNITIQMDGECIFENEIKDLSQLNDCQNIFGNLILAHNVTGTWNAYIGTITGDTDFANYPLWEIKGIINHQGKVYSRRCDGPAYDYVIRVGNCATEPPPPMDDMENTTTTTKAPQAPETFGLEDYEFEHNMVDPVTPARHAWLTEWDTTAIFLVILLGAFFAFLIYLYHCRRDENMQRANLPEGLTRIDDDSLSGLEIFAAEMAQPPFERASSSSDSAITGKSNNSEGSSTASHSTKPATDKSTKPATERSQPSATTKSMSNKAPSDSSTTMSTKPQAESSHDVSTSQSNK